MLASMATRVLGIDPDVNSTAFALATVDQVEQVAVVKSPKGEKGTKELSAVQMIHCLPAVVESMAKKADLIVVEGQQIYTGKSAASTDSILAVAWVTGALTALAATLAPDSNAWIVKPARWKGQTPKHINQARTLSHYDMEFEQSPKHQKDRYSWPSGCAIAAKIKGYHKTNPGDWKHIGDALGIALWGCLKLEQENAKS